MSDLSWEQAVLWLRNQPDKKDIVWDCYYDDPIEAAAERFSRSEEWGAVASLLKSKLPCSVLDIGAGRGISSYAFAKNGCTVTALEPDPSPLVGAGCIRTLVARTGLAIRVVNEFGENLPFPDGSFDVVYGRAVLHHAKDMRAFCKEAFRVLRRGGYLLFTREHVIRGKEDLAAFLDSHALHSLYKGENAFRLREYKKAIRSSGATLLKTLHPFSTPINYAPLKTSVLLESVRGVVRKRLGNLIDERFVGASLVNLVLYVHAMRSKEPDKRYSFLACK